MKAPEIEVAARTLTFCVRRTFAMAPKGSEVKELSPSDKKAVFAALLPFLENGVLKRGSYVRVEESTRYPRQASLAVLIST